MNHSLQQPAELIAGYLSGTLDDAEERMLNAWINESSQHRRIFDLLTNPETLRLSLARHDEKKTEITDQLNASLRFQELHQHKWWYPWRERLGLLAALVVVLLTASFLWLNRSGKRPAAAMRIAAAVLQPDILPGEELARLYLEDSVVVNLVDTVNGLIARQAANDAQVLKENGWLFYHSSDYGDSMSFNSLEVPRKGRFKVILPDGSRVWLNADTRMKYPLLFGNTYRRVHLSGEAYFEVTGLPATLFNPVKYSERLAVAAAHPFLLNVETRTGPAEILVSGSRFNVRAYSDETFVEVLSLEGLVKISKGGKGFTLRRGECGRIFDDGQVSIQSNVPPGPVIAWKDNLFKFDRTPISEVMKVVERWYDVDIRYKEPVQEEITGAYEREAPLSKLLGYLESVSDVKFEVEGNMIRIGR